MSRSIDYYETEGRIVEELNWLVKNANSLFQIIVYEDGNTDYIPKFNFEYVNCNCEKNQNLIKEKEWNSFFSSDKPVIFTNTSFMFKKFKELTGENGAATWADYCYGQYKNRRYNKNIKFIFIIDEKFISEIWDKSNVDFATECMPLYVKKNKSKVLKNVY